MANEPASTVRARRLRERRSRGVVMVAPVEVGEGGVGLLVGSGLLKQHQAGDRHAVGDIETGNQGLGAMTDVFLCPLFHHAGLSGSVGTASPSAWMPVISSTETARTPLSARCWKEFEEFKRDFD